MLPSESYSTAEGDEVNMSAIKYKYPPIEEALCEFTFEPGPQGSQLDFALPGRLQMHPKVKEEYKGQARTQNIQTIASTQNHPAVAIQDAVFRIQLPTEDGTRLISMGVNTLAITVLRPYEGWQSFKPRIESALSAFCEVSGLSTVVRVGIRYINRIIVPAENAKASSFLNFIPEEHEIFGAPVNSFLRRAEYIRPDGVKMIVTQATLQPQSPNTTEYLLDIDTVLDNARLTENSDIIAQAETLHGVESDAFECLITQDARNLFNAD
jgi:uncharacterized protein (TIGR04255 family)